MKTTSDLADDLIEQLHDSACAGEVAEVFVVYRDTAGEWHSGYAADDASTLTDIGRGVLDLIDQRPRRGTKH